MPISPSDELRIYILNVGQNDTSVITTPSGKCIIIDAVYPNKLVDLLDKIGLRNGDTIDELIITHPHKDHHSGSGRLIKNFNIKSVKLAPFWTQSSFGTGTGSYQSMINAIETKKIRVEFISGYSRFYPDASLSGVPSYLQSESIYFEFLGPSNNLINNLEKTGVLEPNHLSIMCRLNWEDFRIIFAADAQMENWSCFDQEGMLVKKCTIMKAAHHGSGEGTQWERITRLNPKYTIISSDPDLKHHLPDLIGAAVFAKYNKRSESDEDKKIVALTKSTGSIRITKPYGKNYYVDFFNESRGDNIDLNNHTQLTWENNPTDWQDLLQEKVKGLYN